MRTCCTAQGTPLGCTVETQHCKTSIPQLKKQNKTGNPQIHTQEHGCWGQSMKGLEYAAKKLDLVRKSTGDC